MSEPATKVDIDRAVLAIVGILAVMMSLLFVGTITILEKRIQAIPACSTTGK